MEPTEYFYLKSGKALKDIEELCVVLETLSEEEFLFHVNTTKNDFANWIRDIFKEEELSNKLREIINKDELKKELELFIRREKKPGKSEKKEAVVVTESEDSGTQKQKVSVVPKELAEGPPVEIPAEDFEEEKRRSPNKDLDLDKELNQVREKYHVHKKEVTIKTKKKQSAISRLFLKIRMSEFFNKTFFKKESVDKQLKNINYDLKEFKNEVEENLND